MPTAEPTRTPNLDRALRATTWRRCTVDGVNFSPQTAPVVTSDLAAPEVTVVVTTACHLCEDAVTELIRRSTLGQVDVEVVQAESERGRTLLSAHRPTMFPLVLVDGRYFSVGRLSRRKLDKALSVERVG